MILICSNTPTFMIKYTHINDKISLQKENKRVGPGSILLKPNPRIGKLAKKKKKNCLSLASRLLCKTKALILHLILRVMLRLGTLTGGPD